MGIFEDIQQMQAEGLAEQQIIGQLSKQGFAPREIAEAMAQMRIKEAVAGADAENGLTAPQQYSPEAPQQQYSEPQQYAQQEYPQQQYQYQQEAAPGYPQQYEQYDQYQSGGMSTDTINEIAEQVVVEKLTPIRHHLEEVLDLKTMLDSKIDYIDDRLKKIEKVIDRLQLSILQKVGSYVTNVEDIKRELQETQKTFKALADSHHKK